MTKQRNEVWKYHPLTKLFYSNFGRTAKPCLDNGLKMVQPDGEDYLGFYVTVMNDVKIYVHDTVAIFFVPNREKGTTVKHRDGNNKNNFSYNLQWDKPF